MTVTGIVTAAMQIAIRSFNEGKTVDQAKKTAVTAFWREYTPETQKAAERAIESYYARQVKPVEVEVVQAKPVDYAAVKKELPRLKAGLTRAKKTNDPRKILAAARKAIARFEEIGYPDDWSIFDSAKEQAETDILLTA